MEISYECANAILGKVIKQAMFDYDSLKRKEDYEKVQNTHDKLRKKAMKRKLTVPEYDKMSKADESIRNFINAKSWLFGRPFHINGDFEGWLQKTHLSEVFTIDYWRGIADKDDMMKYFKDEE